MIDLSRPTNSGATYEIEIYRDDGRRLALLDRVVMFSATRVINNLGGFNIILPADFDSQLIRSELLIFVWRRPADGIKKLIFSGIVKGILKTERENGGLDISLSGPSMNWLLASKITSLSNASVWSGALEDLIMFIVDYHVCAPTDVGGSTVTGVFYPILEFAYNSGIVVINSAHYNNGLGSYTVEQLAGANVLDWLIYVVNYARALGNDIFFDFVATASNVFEFRLYHNQPGRNLTVGNPGEMIFSAGAGNFSDGNLTFDYLMEKNSIYKYVIGSSFISLDGSSTRGEAQYYTNRAFESIYSFSQVVVPISANTHVEGDANEILSNNRPQRSLTGKLKSVSGSIYGVDWEFGDKVNVLFDGQLFETVIRAVTFGIDNTGREILEAAVEITL